MTYRARFPGKPNKNMGKPRVSYHDIKDEDAEETEYSKTASQIVTNLKAFREIVGSSDEDEDDFVGFAIDDAVRVSCQEKLNNIKSDISALKFQISGLNRELPVYPSESSSSIVHFKIAHFLNSTETVPCGSNETHPEFHSSHNSVLPGLKPAKVSTFSGKYHSNEKKEITQMKSTEPTTKIDQSNQLHGKSSMTNPQQISSNEGKQESVGVSVSSVTLEYKKSAPSVALE